MCKRVTSVAHGATRRSRQARTRTDSRNDWRVGPLFARHRINHTTANFLKLRLNTAFQFIIGTSFCALREIPWRCDTGVVCQSTVGVTSCLYNPPSSPLNSSYWACCSVTYYRHGLKRNITFRIFITQKRRFSFSFKMENRKYHELVLISYGNAFVLIYKVVFQMDVCFEILYGRFGLVFIVQITLGCC